MNDWERFGKWKDKNEWYDTNTEMRDWIDDWANRNSYLCYYLRLECGHKAIRERFPEYFASGSIMPCGGRVADCPWSEKIKTPCDRFRESLR